MVYMSVHFFYNCLVLQSLLYGLYVCSFSIAACFLSHHYMVYLSVYFLQLPVSSVATIIWSICLFISTAACFFSRYYMVYLSVHFLQLPISSVATIIWSICLLISTAACFFSRYYMVYLSIFYSCLFLQSLLYGLSVHFLQLPVSSVATIWSICLFISTAACFFSRYYMVYLSVYFYSCLFLQSQLYGLSVCLFLQLPVSSVATIWSICLFISTAACFFSRYYMVYLSAHFLQLPRHLGWTKEGVSHNYRLQRSKFWLFRGKLCPMLSCRFTLSFVLLFLSIVLDLLSSSFHIMLII